MPYKSEKQRRFMYSQHPEIAKKWDKEGENHIESKEKGRKFKKEAIRHGK